MTTIKWLILISIFGLVCTDGAGQNIVTSSNFPSFINVPSSGIETFIVVDQLVPGTKIELAFKGIARTGFTRKEIFSSTTRITTTLEPSQFDEIGLEYYFELTAPNGFKTVSPTGYTYVHYAGSGVPIGDLRYGSKLSDYQIIAIPLKLANRSIPAVFEDDLGKYDNRKWRLFGYENGQLLEYGIEGTPSLDSLEAGKGYWFISKNPTYPTTGEGTTLSVNNDMPFVMNLKKGWNLIGNPYNFSISWTEVKNHSNNPVGLGNLKTYEGGFFDIDTDVLPRFRGGYVFAENDLSIRIPVLKNEAINGRIGQNEKPRHHPKSLWEVNFTIKTQDITYRSGGFGMHPQAQLSKDVLDEITAPRFIDYLEMHVEHPDYFMPHFAKDVVPIGENYTWDFKVEANLPPQQIELSWENFLSDDFEPGKKLILFDPKEQKGIDLLKMQRYSFWLDGQATFQVAYGSEEYINQRLKLQRIRLEPNFPNPFTRTTTLPFSLADGADTYQIRLSIENSLGQRLLTLQEGAYKPGLYEVNWDGKDASGQRLPPGFYLCRMEVASASGKEVFIRKILLQP